MEPTGDSEAEMWQTIERLSRFLTPERSSRLKQVLERRTRRLLVVLENLMDPHNASACIRSCEACGLQEVHVIEELSPFDTSVGVARGSDRWIHLVRHLPRPLDGPGEATRRALESLKERGYRTVAMTPHPNPSRFVPFDELPLDQPIALIFGTEKKGLSRTALSQAELLTLIPIAGFVESYNVSVACALAVFTLGERIRRELADADWQLSSADSARILLEWTRQSINRVEELEADLLKMQSATPKSADAETRPDDDCD